ncbi:GNAT family N-acetyltransferase [Deltaproteobacteria bacterium PRO3]|nr:GNAT family N-acetyltransferase [Deltaproteobacteria bacterium PRO3]
MDIQLRPGQAEDAQDCGRICYEAFKNIAERHGFPPDFPSVEAAVGLLSKLFQMPGCFSVVAEREGRPVGSNFLWELSEVAGVGPITVDPKAQDAAVGRRMMEWVLKRAETQGFRSVRLVQAAYHNRSLSLYTKLGFDAMEPLSVMKGAPLKRILPGFTVRPAVEGDLAACNALHRALHGYEREGELRHAIFQGTAQVVEKAGEVAGYATGIGFLGHAVAENNDALKALIAAAPDFGMGIFLLPTRNGSLLRWCLDQGLKVSFPMTLMKRGWYQEPTGAFLPSVLY